MNELLTMIYVKKFYDIRNCRNAHDSGNLKFGVDVVNKIIFYSFGSISMGSNRENWVRSTYNCWAHKNFAILLYNNGITKS